MNWRIVIAGLLAIATNAVAQSPAADPARYRNRILGVYDETSGLPVEGVEVRDMFSAASSLTTATGTVSLIFIPDGGSFVRLRKVGYEMQTFAVAISPADTAPITIVLRKAVTLPTVTIRDSAPTYISGSLRSAVERIRSHAGGYFIDEAEMRKWDNSTMADAIRAKMAGLLSVTGPHGETFFVSSRKMCKQSFGCTTHPDCFISVYLNGVLSPVMPDFARVSSMEYAIAEFYPSAATQPVEFPGGCGSLVLWSRER